MDYGMKLWDARKQDQKLFEAASLGIDPAAIYRKIANLPPVAVPIPFKDLRAGDTVAIQRQDEDGWDMELTGELKDEAGVLYIETDWEAITLHKNWDYHLIERTRA